MAEKTVVWYYDGNGNVHNLQPVVGADNASISFTMPLSDAEVWITNELTIYLDKYSIQFTPYGFTTSLEDTVFSTATDTVYLYQVVFFLTQGLVKYRL